MDRSTSRPSSSSPSEEMQRLKYLLNKYKIKPRRESGQNFLVNDQIAKKIITAAEVNKEDIILEIGSGLGAMTPYLCAVAKKVITVEQDRNFIPILNQLKPVCPNLEIINSDIFKVNLEKNNILNGKFKIVANLPYNITSLIFRYFLEHGPRPSVMSVLVQKEVAERIVAKPGQLSKLAISVQLFGEPKIVQIVPKKDFFPEPKIDSAILLINNICLPSNIYDIKKFFRIINIGFSSKRKTLANNLSVGLKLDKKEAISLLQKSNINVNCRAQELSLEQWGIIVDRV
ncbi:MAG: 16S rRNA (adenine(1518)-N(6)/adenine(1519)-N(6))-dimethyltransferase RsmA [Patescibacteria group bacterium]